MSGNAGQDVFAEGRRGCDDDGRPGCLRHLGDDLRGFVGLWVLQISGVSEEDLPCAELPEGVANTAGLVTECQDVEPSAGRLSDLLGAGDSCERGPFDLAPFEFRHYQ